LGLEKSLNESDRYVCKLPTDCKVGTLATHSAETDDVDSYCACIYNEKYREGIWLSTITLRKQWPINSKLYTTSVKGRSCNASAAARGSMRSTLGQNIRRSRLRCGSSATPRAAGG